MGRASDTRRSPSPTYVRRESSRLDYTVKDVMYVCLRAEAEIADYIAA